MSWGLSDVTVRFGRQVALDGVTLDVPARQVTCVVGGDGAGKSTLLRAMAGALAVSSGEVRHPEAERVGYLAATSGTYPDLSVDENLAFAATAYGVAPSEARRRGTDYLERTGLAAAHDRLAGHLSGGMRQKLGVVRALLHRPDLVVLDEPTTGIDPVSRADLWWLIARAAADGAAVLFSTTYLDEAERATGLLVLDAGRALAGGTPAEIVASMPGAIHTRTVRPPGDEARRSWRRRDTWRTWDPDGGRDGDVGRVGDAGRAGDADGVDLQDAVTVMALARERAPAGGTP
jgi:ABC-2 type transport system ATP-binding protein